MASSLSKHVQCCFHRNNVLKYLRFRNIHFFYFHWCRFSWFWLHFLFLDFFFGIRNSFRFNSLSKGIAMERYVRIVTYSMKNLLLHKSLDAFLGKKFVQQMLFFWEFRKMESGFFFNGDLLESLQTVFKSVIFDFMVVRR